MVDVTRAVHLLQRLTDRLDYLERKAAQDRRALRADEDALGAVKYAFVTAFEAVLGVAHHVCASEGWGPPATNADAVRLLATHGVLDAEIAGRLAAGVGFGNLLLHQYADVDDDLVVAYLDGVGDLRAFVGQTSAWVRAQS